VTDPLVGCLSDRTRSRFGRRKVRLYGSALPIALGMELTPHYHERTRLFGYVHMIGFIGSLLELGALQLLNMADDRRAFAQNLSVVAGVLVFLAIVITTRFLPERYEFQGRGQESPFRAIADVFRNAHARLLLVVSAIEHYGMASIMTLTPYLVAYVFPLEAQLVLVMVTYAVPQVAFTPFWMWLARRIGKQRAWCCSTRIFNRIRCRAKAPSTPYGRSSACCRPAAM